MSDELKPCPFCGQPGERWIDDSGDRDSKVHGCRPCGELFYGDEDEWNTRPIEDALRAERDALKVELQQAREIAAEITLTLDVIERASTAVQDAFEQTEAALQQTLAELDALKKELEGKKPIVPPRGVVVNAV